MGSHIGNTLIHNNSTFVAQGSCNKLLKNWIICIDSVRGPFHLQLKSNMELLDQQAGTKSTELPGLIIGEERIPLAVASAVGLTACTYT